MAPTLAYQPRPILSSVADKINHLSARAVDTMQAPWSPIPHGSTTRIPSFREIVGRSTDAAPATSDSSDNSDNMINAMITVLAIVFFAGIMLSLLFMFRRARNLQRLRSQGLPTYNEVKHNPKHRGLTIETKHNGQSNIYVIGRDGQPMLQNPNSAPDSPDNVPEIHITFPDEQDDQGRSKSGRVLVVRVGENATVGLEPMQDEQLPAYEKEAKGQFISINMDHIGGLKEKDRNVFQ